MGLTYDAGALIRAQRDTRWAWNQVYSAQRYERSITVPAPALSQIWRSGWMSTEFHELMQIATVEATDEALAKLAGELLGRTGTSDAVDAIVACSAARRGDVVLTTDPHDMQRLADDLRSIRVVGV